MFTQFHVRYPTGSLISDLITIDHGKYIVKVSVQVEGVTRATAMAAADTIEQAEDRARIRALEVLGIHSLSSIQQEAQNAHPSANETLRQPMAYSAVEPAFSAKRFDSAKLGSISTDTSWLDDTSELSPPEQTTSVAASSVIVTPLESSANWKANVMAEIPSVATVATLEEESEPTITFGKVTPISSRRHEQDWSVVQPEPADTETSDFSQDVTAESTPIDRSSEIAKIGVEIKRLGWNNKQGSDFLKRTYGKKTRQELTDEELLDFLSYLESQPDPPL